MLDREIFGRILQGNGTPISQPFRISHMGIDENSDHTANRPRVAWNSADNHHLVVWSGDDIDMANPSGETHQIWGQRIAANGAPLDSNQFAVTATPATDFSTAPVDAALIHSPTLNEHFVAHTQRRRVPGTFFTESDIYLQRIFANGTRNGDSIQVTETGSAAPDVLSASSAALAYNSVDNQVCLVWQADGLNDGESEVFGRVLSGTGSPLGAVTRLSQVGPDGDTSRDAEDPWVAHSPETNEYLVVWTGDDDNPNDDEVYGQLVTGAETGQDDFLISGMGPPGDTDWRAEQGVRVAWSPGRSEYLVAWEGNDDRPFLDPGECEICVQSISATGEARGVDDLRISDSGADGDPGADAHDPAIAWNAADNEFLVVWHGRNEAAGADILDNEMLGQRLAGEPSETPPADVVAAILSGSLGLDINRRRKNRRGRHCDGRQCTVGLRITPTRSLTLWPRSGHNPTRRRATTRGEPRRLAPGAEKWVQR